ncbi:MAG TPA: hypothetical protein VF885_05765 [Arthrobacter sp.]
MTNVFKKSLLVAGIASLLLTTGCAATPVKAAEAPAATASSTATATGAPTTTSETGPPADYDIPYEFDALAYADPRGTKAGESMRVTGGTMKPGAVATVYVAQLMAMPSQDATGMYHQVGEQIKLTTPVSVTVNEKGEYDVQIPIPAGTAPQQVDVISELTGVAPGDPSGGLSRSVIR